MLMYKLKTLRKKKALSQREIAKLAGIAASTYNKIEKGLQEARPSTKRKIAAVLNVSVEDIQF